MDPSPDGPFKGSSDPSRFIFEINLGKIRIRHKTTLNLKDVIKRQLGIRGQKFLAAGLPLNGFGLNYP